ncbi:hypothetical protein [Yoonia maritima]|uniref:hypothetical protein n=1 Tax=Yoonia maritima TaxID=1435347 RepID=UPI000D0F79CB|nr:hypothetical protein [Yoonia maritima]
MRLQLAAAFLGISNLFGSAVTADGTYFDGWIVDGEFPSDPRFPGTPAVWFEVYGDQSPNRIDPPLGRGSPDVERDNSTYVFESEPIFGNLARTYAFFKIDVPGYTLAEAPETDVAVRRIPEDVSDTNGLVPVQFELVRRSVIADASRQEATRALDIENPGPSDFERADTSARTAVQINPTLDNVLNLFDILRKANRSGYTELIADFHTTEALESLPGYENFDFNDQWRLRRELLNTLARMPNLDSSLGFGGSVRDAAIAVGEEMIDELSEGADYRELPVIEVFRTLSNLHSTDGDCPSLIENSARALELSDEAAMRWGSRRLFLLEWADCLLIRSGIGDGRSEENFLSDASNSPVLSTEWARFEAIAANFEASFAFPSSDSDTRLLSNYERAQSISDRRIDP